MTDNLTMGHKSNKKHLQLRANSNCWICEGWSEFYFEFTVPTKIDPLTVPVKLHLSTDDYVGEILVLDKEKSTQATKHTQDDQSKLEKATE